MITTEYVRNFLAQQEEAATPDDMDYLTYVGMISLSLLLDKLREPGTFISLELDHIEALVFYLLQRFDDRGISEALEAFTLDEEAAVAIERCGDCANFSEETQDGLAYGPYCSSYSSAQNIARNRMLSQLIP